MSRVFLSDMPDGAHHLSGNKQHYFLSTGPSPGPGVPNEECQMARPFCGQPLLASAVPAATLLHGGDTDVEGGEQSLVLLALFKDVESS